MKKVQTSKNNAGRTSFVRTDLTIRDLMAAAPSSRWDVEYWNPKFEKLLKDLSKWQARTLEEIEGPESVISGDHARKSKSESKGYGLGTSIEYYETKGFLPVAYDYSQIKECSVNTYTRLSATAVVQNDILISCAGVGGVGEARSCFISNVPAKKSCTGDVFIIRLKKVDPIFFFVFLNSSFGKLQILRQQAGVGTVNINTSQVLNIRVPDLGKKLVGSINKEYSKILKMHDKAMGAKKKGDDAGYRKNIEVAEKMLKDLIAKTEAVIRGERKDVI